MCYGGSGNGGVVWGQRGGNSDSWGVGQREGKQRDIWEIVHESQKPQVRQMFILFSVDNRKKNADGNLQLAQANASSSEPKGKCSKVPPLCRADPHLAGKSPLGMTPARTVSSSRTCPEMGSWCWGL